MNRHIFVKYVYDYMCNFTIFLFVVKIGVPCLFQLHSKDLNL